MSSILGVPCIQCSDKLTLVGTSYFASFGQSHPYLYEQISSYFGKSLRGYTVDNDNNGKVAHDRIRKIHNVIDGINNLDCIFLYWGVNDMMYQIMSPLEDRVARMVRKVANSHYTTLANCFSKSFSYFVDAPTKVNTTSFADTSQTYASKSFTVSKNVLVLTDDTSYVEFEGKDKLNIVYFVSDGVTKNLGSFDIYVNGELHTTVECNNQTINLTGYNNTIPTVGDADASPNSIVLRLSPNTSTIRIQNNSELPVWLDYYSELETDINSGAKPVYLANIPKFEEGIVIYSRWQVFNANIELANAALKDVYDFWHKKLCAPVALADAYTDFIPSTMMNPDDLHFSPSGSAFVVQRYNEAILGLFDRKLFVI